MSGLITILRPNRHKIDHFGDVPQANVLHWYGKLYLTSMWANQRDGCPDKHSWRPLFNAEKFGWRRLLECCAVTLPRRETH